MGTEREGLQPSMSFRAFSWDVLLCIPARAKNGHTLMWGQNVKACNLPCPFVHSVGMTFCAFPHGPRMVTHLSHNVCVAVEPDVVGGAHFDEFGHPSSRPFACSACVKCLSNGWSPGWLNLATRRVGPLHALPSESASVMKPWTRRALPVVKAFKALDTEGRALVKVRARRMN